MQKVVDLETDRAASKHHGRKVTALPTRKGKSHEEVKAQEGQIDR
jgi:hypothetical protein